MVFYVTFHETYERGLFGKVLQEKTQVKYNLEYFTQLVHSKENLLMTRQISNLENELTVQNISSFI